MKDPKPSMERLRELCSEVREDDGIDPREFTKEKRIRKTTSRDRQLCAQVKRCLELALPDALTINGIPVCELLSVDPAPDNSRLSVVVMVGADHLVITREVLSRVKGRLRSEVAQAVHRKKAPDLAFEVIAAEEVDHV